MPSTMDAETTYEALLAKIYDAALVRDGWSVMVAAVTEALGGAGGSLLFQDRSQTTPETDITAIKGYPEHAGALYAEQFAQQDRRIGMILAAPPGQIMADEWHYDYATYLQTSIYNDFYRPLGLARAIGVRLFSDGNRGGVLSAFREPERGSYGLEDIRLMERLAPHIMRALQLKRQLDRMNMLANGLASGLDRLPQAVLLLGFDGRVLELNKAADELLAVPASPLSLKGGRLHAVRAAEDATLQRILQEVSSLTPQGRCTPPEVLSLRSHEGSVAFGLMAVPIRRADQLGLSHTQGVLVFVAGATLDGGIDPLLLTRQYGLSHAEASIAAALSAGESVNEIADRRQVSRQTVRTQVKIVLGKTGTSSQGKLIALLSRGLGALKHR